jgi:hypothetical protein
MCLLLGIITSGIALNQKLALTSGVREGSRYGATLSVASTSCTSGPKTMDCWLKQVADIAAASSEGDLDLGQAGHELCVAYVYPAGTLATDRSTKLVRTSSGDVITTGTTCIVDGRPSDERRVQVVSSRPGKIEYMFGSVRPTLSSDSVTKFEAV